VSEVVNPYIAGNPVTGTDMFFGREDVFTFTREALTGRHRDNVIVLYGQRRTGKTSVLYQMSRHLGPRYLCIFVDLHGLALEGLGGFLWELANYIQRTLRREYQIELPRLDQADFAANPRSAFENDFLSLVWSAIGDRHILLMLDEAIRLQEQIQAGKLEKDIFEYLRHLMQHNERLNFMFSLGSGLEEMEKEYAFLFSVGLYKKISFLKQDAATALITQPVRDCYQVAPAAIERILQVTSGHAYYTQLLCHSLFNRWRQQRQPQVRVADVNAILNEVVERGLAVLKHIWEESTAGEKAVLAGLAACMGERNHPVGLGEVDRVWAQHGVALPQGEKAKAIQGLIARDIIVGQDRYAFTVDLQRLWAQKYERLGWVKEEIVTDVQRWNLEASRVVIPRPLRWKPTLFISLGIVLATAVSFLAWQILKPVSGPRVPATPTTQSTPVPLYTSGQVIYVSQDTDKNKYLHALRADGAIITLTRAFSDVVVLSVSPDSKYLAVAVSNKGELVASAEFPRFWGGISGKDLIVISVESLQQNTLVSEGFPFSAVYLSDGQLLIALLEKPTVTYYVSNMDGSGKRVVYTSTNELVTPTATATRRP
jgi:hypothetical protein